MNAAMTIGVAFLAWFMTTQFARAAERLPARTVLDIINRVNAQEFGGWFDPVDVLAVAEIESNFDPGAYRAEPQLNPPDASIGLMQTLYLTALDRGLVGGPAGLFDPEVSIRIGMRQLRWSWDYLSARRGEPPTRDQWIGSYNAGVGNVLKGYLPLAYVQKFNRAREAWARTLA